MINYFKIISLLLFVLCFEATLVAQTKVIGLTEVTITGQKKSVFKELSLYDVADSTDEPNIDGFYALNLFNDKLSDEIWFTKNKSCITANTDNIASFAGKSALKIKWDKMSGECNWIGMGFGWNNWLGKDLSSIIGKAAIQFYVKTNGDTLSSLPLAIALEDYSGTQAYTGFSKTFIQAGKLTGSWSKVIIPLTAFPITQTDLDISNIKQFIIQFEASGDLIIDEMTIIPFTGNLKPKISIQKPNKPIIIDGNINGEEWDKACLTINEKNNIFIQYDSANIYIAAQIIDAHALMNKFEDADMWNGDAIEFSIGTSADADLSRTRYLLSDYQIGIKCVEKAYVWNWKNKTKISNAEVKVLKNITGYSLEAKIPISSFNGFKPELGKAYGFEIAIDDGDQSGKRINQYRWASSHMEGFNLNPSLWGLILIK